MAEETDVATVQIDEGVTSNSPAPPTDSDTKPTRPEFIPEKFWNSEKGEANYEALGKSYGELETKLAQSPGIEDQPSEESGDQPAAQDTPALQPFFDEFARDGQLTEVSYKALEANHGLPREVVDHYIVNQRTASEANDRTLLASIGGQESFDEVSEWANTNLPATEVDQINNVLAAGNTEQSVLVLQGLKNRYQEATGSDPQLLLSLIHISEPTRPY